MIINKKSILNKINALLEHSATELSTKSDPARKARSRGIITYFEGIEQGPDGHARTIWKVPSESTRDLNYRVTIAIIVPKTSLFTIARQKWDPTKFVDVLKNSDVKVHCTCADFLYGGIKYNLGAGKYKGALEPKNSGYRGEQTIPEPANIRDPEGNHVLCKHCIAVADRLGANNFNIMKSAKNYDMKTLPTEVDPNKTETKLKKDINMIDLDEDRKTKITESIIRGASEPDEETLEKDQMVPEEKEEVVDEVLEKQPEEELDTEVKEVPLEEEKIIPEEEIIEEPLEEKQEVEPEILEKDKPTEDVKLDSDFNDVSTEPEEALEKDKSDEDLNNEKIKSIFDREN